MTLSYQFGNRQFDIQADRIEETQAGLILHGAQICIDLPIAPHYYYRHGWQSWSLTTWQDANLQLPIMKPELFHSRQTDPVYAKYPTPNGSWLGAVEFPEGDILFLGALGLEAHVAYRDGSLIGWYETGKGEWLVASGNEFEIFARYADLLKARFGQGKAQKPPRVWCSWYSLYDTITEKNLQQALTGLGDLPFDVFQIDDGWEIGPGDWEPNQKFPSGMQKLADDVKATGRKAGLWLAPLLIGKFSSVYKQHPEWLLRDAEGKLVFAGFEFGEEIYALDSTHPEAAHWLSNQIVKVRSWGYEYLKLDFLYAGALPGKRHIDIPRETAYRQALEIIRNAAGDAYLLACGCPILPSLGLCDGIRIGADVAGVWDNKFYSYYLYNQTAPSVQNAIRTTVHRLWLEPLLHVDPDVAYFSSQSALTHEQRRLLQNLTEICGFKATSDLPKNWNEHDIMTIRNWLDSSKNVQRTGRYTFELDGRAVDFAPALPLPHVPTGFDKLLHHLLGHFGNQIWALKLWHRLFRHNAQTP